MNNMIRKAIGSIVLYQFEGLQDSGATHAFFSRLGGASAPPFATLNLGHTVGDELAAVEENHRRALAALDVTRDRVVSPYQVHGTHVRLVGVGHTGTVQPSSDGLLTTTPEVALLLRFADCVPLLLYDPTRRAIALVHSGRKGSAGNIAAAAVEALARHAGSQPRDLWAGIGPAIGPCCYRVEPELAEAVERTCPPGSKVSRQQDGATTLDLPGAVQAQLAAAGVRQIEMAGICTACHTEEWFSHRAEGGHTGRFGALALLR